MRPRTPRLLACSLVALLGAACTPRAPAAVPAAPATAIQTATPYARAPQPIIVDPSGAVTGGAASGREVTYRVEAGDTLLGLANRFDTTVEAIMRRNGLTNASDLKIGQDLVVPTNATVVATATPAAAGTPAPRAPTPAPGPPPGGGQTYTVERGDTAFDIAAQFGVTVEALAQANNRTVGSLANLQAGEKLAIPRAR